MDVSFRSSLARISFARSRLQNRHYFKTLGSFPSLIIYPLLLFLLASSCSPQKSVSNVFPESQSNPNAKCLGQAVEGKYILHWEDGSFSVVENMDKEKFIKDVVTPQLDHLKHVDMDRRIQLNQTESMNTTANSPVTNKNWHTRIIEADALWSKNILGQGVIVGVVDSYVDISHPQIAARILKNTKEIPDNGIDDDNNGYVDDYRGYIFYKSGSSAAKSDHGTHVTGIIAADKNATEVEGLAPSAQIVPAQFIDGTGGGDIGDGILALQYAVSRGAKIVNASWGGPSCVENLKNAFDQASRAGVLLVVAAGNDGNDIDVKPEFPAAFNLANQLTVAASSIDDFMTSWSNRGFKRAHIGAPGDNIYSTIPGGYTYMSGTSMAAPVVSGVAALLWSAKPTATADAIRQAIMSSVDISEGHEFKVASQGRINARKAYEYLMAH